MPYYLFSWSFYTNWYKCSEDQRMRWEIKTSKHVQLIAVENADFEAYRKKFGKGGDFVIYSDVQWYDVTYSWDI